MGAAPETKPTQREIYKSIQTHTTRSIQRSRPASRFGHSSGPPSALPCQIGKLQITRASHLEPERDGFWWACLGALQEREGGAQAERGWLVTCRHGMALTANKAVPTMDDPLAVRGKSHPRPSGLKIAHSADRRKRRRFPEATVAASSGGCLIHSLLADHAIAGRVARGWKACPSLTALACRFVVAR